MRAKQKLDVPEMGLSFFALYSKFHFSLKEYFFLVLGGWVVWPLGVGPPSHPPPAPPHSGARAACRLRTRRSRRPFPCARPRVRHFAPERRGLRRPFRRQQPPCGARCCPAHRRPTPPRLDKHIPAPHNCTSIGQKGAWQNVRLRFTMTNSVRRSPPRVLQNNARNPTMRSDVHSSAWHNPRFLCRGTKCSTTATIRRPFGFCLPHCKSCPGMNPSSATVRPRILQLEIWRYATSLRLRVQLVGGRRRPYTIRKPWPRPQANFFECFSFFG